MSHSAKIPQFKANYRSLFDAAAEAKVVTRGIDWSTRVTTSAPNRTIPTITYRPLDLAKLVEMCPFLQLFDFEALERAHTTKQLSFRVQIEEPSTTPYPFLYDLTTLKGTLNVSNVRSIQGERTVTVIRFYPSYPSLSQIYSTRPPDAIIQKMEIESKEEGSSSRLPAQYTKCIYWTSTPGLDAITAHRNWYLPMAPYTLVDAKGTVIHGFPNDVLTPESRINLPNIKSFNAYHKQEIDLIRSGLKAGTLRSINQISTSKQLAPVLMNMPNIIRPAVGALTGDNCFLNASLQDLVHLNVFWEKLFLQAPYLAELFLAMQDNEVQKQVATMATVHLLSSGGNK